MVKVNRPTTPTLVKNKVLQKDATPQDSTAAPTVIAATAVTAAIAATQPRWIKEVKDLFCPEDELVCKGDYMTLNVDESAYDKDGPIHLRELHGATIHKLDKQGNSITFSQEFGNKKVLIEVQQVQILFSNGFIEIRRRLNTIWKALPIETTDEDALSELYSARIFGS